MLLEGPAAISAQLLLAVAAIGALVYKRWAYDSISACLQRGTPSGEVPQPDVQAQREAPEEPSSLGFRCQQAGCLGRRCARVWYALELTHGSELQAQAGKQWQRHVVRGAGIVIAILASETGKQTVSQCAW